MKVSLMTDVPVESGQAESHDPRGGDLTTDRDVKCASCDRVIYLGRYRENPFGNMEPDYDPGDDPVTWRHLGGYAACHTGGFATPVIPDEPLRTHSATNRAERATVLIDMMAQVVEFEEAKGWQPNDNRFAESLALLGSEVFEALDAYRKYGFNVKYECSLPDVASASAHTAECKPVDVPSELADVLIRLLSTWYQWMTHAGFDLASEFERKMAYNWTRTHRHGGRLL